MSAEAHFLETLFGGRFPTRLTSRLGSALADLIVAGGYPAALARPTPARRRAWYRDLVETQIQRDVRDVARIHSPEALPRLLALAASHTAQLHNVSDLAAPFQMTRQTIHDYVTVLERVFLVDRLPPWRSNRLSRLVKTAKVHMGDTGLASALLGIDAGGLNKDRDRLGPLLEHGGHRLPKQRLLATGDLSHVTMRTPDPGRVERFYRVLPSPSRARQSRCRPRCLAAPGRFQFDEAIRIDPATVIRASRLQARQAAILPISGPTQ